MCEELLNKDDAFTKAFREFDKIFRSFSGYSLENQLSFSPDLAQASFWHPAIMAVEYALFQKISPKIQKPSLILPQSGGENMAALLFGVYSLSEGIRLIYEETHLMGKLPPGRLLLLAGPQKLSLQFASQYGLQLAGINSPSSIVVGGPPGLIEELLLMPDLPITLKLLPSDFSFHTPALDPYLAYFYERIKDLKPSSSLYPIISSVEARVLPGQSFDASYFSRMISRPFYFEKAATLAMELGARTFVDFSPHPVLQFSLNEIAQHLGYEVRIYPLMEKNTPYRVLWKELEKGLAKL
jgi:acyl transferase domain-containing protein